MPQTLNELLMEKMNMEAETDAEAIANADTLMQIKEAIKQWLTEADLSNDLSEERVRNHLMRMVDE